MKMNREHPTLIAAAGTRLDPYSFPPEITFNWKGEYFTLTVGDFFMHTKTKISFEFVGFHRSDLELIDVMRLSDKKIFATKWEIIFHEWRMGNIERVFKTC